MLQQPMHGHLHGHTIPRSSPSSSPSYHVFDFFFFFFFFFFLHLLNFIHSPLVLKPNLEVTFWSLVFVPDSASILLAGIHVA